MPNIATALKAEITRVARKEIRSEAAALKTAVTKHRTDIAALKRLVESLQRQLRHVGKERSAAPPSAPDEGTGKSVRFSAKGLAKQRKRLGLSAEDLGRLLGASGQSVYNWEAGSARPRAKHLAAIVALRALSKKRALEALESLAASK
jgi:DNA-binding transcriptional regulator YiaG